METSESWDLILVDGSFAVDFISLRLILWIKYLVWCRRDSPRFPTIKGFFLCPRIGGIGGCLYCCKYKTMISKRIGIMVFFAIIMHSQLLCRIAKRMDHGSRGGKSLPQERKDNMNQIMNRKSENYKEFFTKDYLMGPNSLRLLDEVLQKYPLKPGSRVMDLGCGAGCFLQALNTKNCRMLSQKLQWEIPHFCKSLQRSFYAGKCRCRHTCFLVTDM